MSDQSRPQPKTGAEVVVRTLEERGVKHVFGVPGAKIDAVFNALVDSSIQTVVCRHEQNAAFIAGGIGRMTGKAGVAIATSGPGVSNLVTGLATASSEGDPVVALGGAVATAETLKQIHQTMDSVSICKPVTKFSAAVGSPESVAEVVSNAFRAAESGRPGSAFVSLPKDIMGAPAQGRLLTPPSFAGAGVADGAAMREAARLISAARTPVVLLGLLASRPDHAEAVRAFIAHNNLPVVGTFQSIGAVGAHLMANFGGRVGQLANQPADRLLEAADVVITIGYDPVEYDPSIWNSTSKRPVIHIDALPADLDNCYCPAVELTGDIGQTLAALSPRVDRHARPAIASSMLDAIDKERRHLADAAASKSGAPVHPLRFVAALQPMLGDDVTLCLDIGSFHLWLARHLYSFRARQVLISNGQQTLGVALPWAIAATLVRPHEKVCRFPAMAASCFRPWNSKPPCG
ncbi:Acetolactate synthase, catabolic [Paraburkholderia humisilvae]|uniref:Acetolactate synthase, catabolic n=1 Tax=Paraburkholderia humisilvae TaxID=627669 RepID=A0A6J5DDJ5_9BURK|nr:Acetolactate synthase, catabolic [Paraburkholderia humisilvae]